MTTASPGGSATPWVTSSPTMCGAQELSVPGPLEAARVRLRARATGRRAARASCAGTRRIGVAAIIWEKPFETGEATCRHAIANLEHHHFKYALFRRPAMSTFTSSAATSASPTASAARRRSVRDRIQPVRPAATQPARARGGGGGGGNAPRRGTLNGLILVPPSPDRPPTPALPRKRGGRRWRPARQTAPSPSMGEGWGGGDEARRDDRKRVWLV